MVLGEGNGVRIPEALAHAAGLHVGSRVEMVATPEGVLLKPSPLTREEKLAILDSLEGEGRRLMPNAGDQVAALLRDRAEDDAECR